MIVKLAPDDARRLVAHLLREHGSDRIWAQNASVPELQAWLVHYITTVIPQIRGER